MANTRVAVLIDAENLAATHAGQIFREISKYGNTAARRAYGDFARGRGTNWLAAATLHAVDTVQVCSSGTGKNSSDIRLTIDAIELFANNKADIFCLCTSDGDFAPLAKYLRGVGKLVVGFGGRQASISFRQSCDTFVVVEYHSPPEKPKDITVAKPLVPSLADKPKSLLALVQLAITDTSDDKDGWLNVGILGSAVRRINPQFDKKNYGVGTFSAVLRKDPALEVRDRNGGLYVRVKPGISVLSANPTAVPACHN